MSAEDRKTVVAFQTPWLTHVVENLVFLILQKPGYRIVILTGKKEDAPPGSEHPEGYARLQKMEEVELLPEDAPARFTDYMVVRLKRNGFLWHRNLNEWVRRSSELGFLSDAYYFNDDFKKRAAELIYNFPYWLQSKFGIFQTSSLVPIPYSHLRKKIFHSPYVHPQHLMNEEWRSRIFQTVQARQKRRFRLVFVGNENPEARRRILKTIGDMLSREPGVVVHKKIPDSPLDPGQRHVLWIQYNDHDKVRGMNPDEYIKILQQSEFCLCPQGWDLWSHRVAECLLSGAVPVIEHGQFYDLPLKDGINCLLTGNEGWAATVSRTLTATPADCSAMQQKVVELAAAYLSVSSMAASLHRIFDLKGTTRQGGTSSHGND